MNQTTKFSLGFSVFGFFSVSFIMVLSLAPNLLFKHLLLWFVGIIFFLIGKQFNPRQFYPLRWWLLIFSCLIISFPIIFNNVTRGSRRWINLGFVSIQPSEITKPLLLLSLANSVNPVPQLIPILITAAQPDLGSAISLVILALPVILFKPRYLKISILIFFIITLLSPVIWRNFLHQYQRDRISTFLNPQTDPSSKGYQTIQSKIAIGSAGVFGKGFRKGTQGQLLFLPEKHTDFIFAATTEELGLFTASLIIVCFYLLISSLIKYCQTLDSQPKIIFTMGLIAQIWFQAFINIGMNLGLLPITGIPLPFLSVGGSSLVSLLFSLGLVFSD